jgi:gamma-glutamyl:cysteine ligase YbdK (ATP-grasp superfamily)
VNENRVDAPGEFRLFEVYGIEIEYMIVDSDRLSVLPVTDEVLRVVAGEYSDEVEMGALSWSNELALHVIELKTNGPSPTLTGLAEHFQADVRRINTLLEKLGGRLMPTAMHPWMDPASETRLWPHDHSPVYEAFNRIFNCSGHGWSNLQSVHINLPFRDDKEFARLHAAIRLALPLLPALAASSPLMDGRTTGLLDSRLDVYRSNARRVPSVSGSVIPEPVYSRAEYEGALLGSIYRDLAPLDPEGVLQHEWVNARGAIARFDRHAIEIRVLDTQECPAADLAIAALVSNLVRTLGEERWCNLATLQNWDTAALYDVLLRCIRAGERAEIGDSVADRRLLQAYGFPERGICRAQDLWQHVMETVMPQPSADTRAFRHAYLRGGTLAQRILTALGNDSAPSPTALRDVYARLCDCLQRGELLLA